MRSEASASERAANLTINGHPVGLNATGQFDAVVDLGGQSLVELELNSPTTGEQSILRIPLTLLGPGGTIPSTVLDPLRNAGITVTVPPGGFEALDGDGLDVDLRVLTPEELLSLTINGTDVTDQVGPGGTTTVPVPGGSKELVVVATGRNGVSQTTTFPVNQLSSVINTVQGASVSAASAQGLRIASIRYQITNTNRIRMVVVVKDKRGYLVHGASVRVNGLPARVLLNGVHRHQQARQGDPGAAPTNCQHRNPTEDQDQGQHTHRQGNQDHIRQAPGPLTADRASEMRAGSFEPALISVTAHEDHDPSDSNHRYQPLTPAPTQSHARDRPRRTPDQLAICEPTPLQLHRQA